MSLTVRELQPEDIDSIVAYWTKSDDQHLQAMGVDLNKKMDENRIRSVLQDQLSKDYQDKMTYTIIWCQDGIAIGHCNINEIKYGEEAFMHLHLWGKGSRKRGAGTEFVKLSIPYFLKNFKLRTLYCEPNADNPAPNKTLPKAGFRFVKKYRTIPSIICAEQEVNQYKISAEDFLT